MIYCVELAFAQPSREAEWNTWYSDHLGILLSIPGFTTAQRFESTAPCRAPYLAAYSVTSADIYESAPYKQRGGRGAPGEWAPLMINWDRNLFEGLTHMPEVQPHQFLVVVDGALGELAKFPVQLSQLDCVGLDLTVKSRGIAVLAADEYAKLAPSADEGIRFYRTLTPQLRAVN
jgi:hypothetical protein